MITAREKGRHLELIVGGGEESLTFLVPPVPSKVGAELFADWVGIKFGQLPPEKAAESATSLAERVLGPEVFPRMEELRAAEVTSVINAAFLWNVQGGGIELVNTFLTDGLPKAHETLLQASGLKDVHSLLLTLLNSASANPTSTGDTPATSTPAGGESSSVSP